MDMSPLYVSLKTSFVATIITFFIGIVIAWLMARYRGRGKDILDTILTLPLVLPPTVVGFILLLVLGKNGFIGKTLNYFNINLIFSWSATVIAAVFAAFPLMYKTTKGAFEQIDENILNAARTLGATEWRIFKEIAAPLAWPGIAAGTVLAFARALGEFGATMMIAGNIPGKTQTIPLAIYFAAEGGEMDKAKIWVLLVVLLSVSVIVSMNNFTQRQIKNTYLSWRK